MEQKINFRLPPVGLRIVKSAIAVALCFVVAAIRGNSGIVFYSQLAALWCIQMYTSNTMKNAVQRTIGTMNGALYGLVFLLIQRQCGESFINNGLLRGTVISLMVIIVLYTTVLIKKKQASYFSCVVFLSIAVNHFSDANPYLFVWNRFLDTMIGIVIGIGVNNFSLPRVKKKDILFVAQADTVLFYKGDTLSDYSKVELNRMLDSGVSFTLFSMRTPAALMDAMRDIRLKLPVILMDGAVLYDIINKRYEKVYVISNQHAKEVEKLISQYHLSCFINVIIDDMLVIYYDHLTDPIQQQLVTQLRRSPYRNYVQRPLPEGEDVVYFMLLDHKETIEHFYRALENEGYTKKLKVLMYDSVDYPGYAYIKIYNKNASAYTMVRYLQSVTGLEKVVTVGSEKGKHDVTVDVGRGNKMLKQLKNAYEPTVLSVWLHKHKRKIK